MTQITRDTVQHLAQLSSLLLDETEIDKLRTDIEAILAHIEQLSELNTDGIEPSYQVTDLENVWREDSVVDEGVTRDQLIALAAKSKDGQIEVPKVLAW